MWEVAGIAAAGKSVECSSETELTPRGAHTVSAHVGGCLERDVSQFSIHPCDKIH